MTIRKGQYWYVDLSPAIGEELGGVRKCLIVKKKKNLVQVIPSIYNGQYTYNKFHIRTVDIKRLKEKTKK
jgi:mRNA-degrading endonuclease toxin of MazEF toxin-antitoxin module